MEIQKENVESSVKYAKWRKTQAKRLKVRAKKNEKQLAPKLARRVKGGSLPIPQLVERIERLGGKFRVDGRHVYPENIPVSYEKAMRAGAQQITRYILDRAWTPERDSLPGGTALTPACTCREYPYPHIHKDSGPPVNHEPEQDAFQELKDMIRQADTAYASTREDIGAIDEAIQAEEAMQAIQTDPAIKLRLCLGSCGLKLTIHEMRDNEWFCTVCGTQGYRYISGPGIAPECPRSDR